MYLDRFPFDYEYKSITIIAPVNEGISVFSQWFSFPKPFVFKGPNSNPRDDVSGQVGMKRPVNQRLGHQAYGQSNNSMKR